MKTRTKRLLLIICGSLLLIFGGVSWLGYTLLSPNSFLNRASTIDSILTWGRLASFPSSAQQLTIDGGGSMFTRSFRTSFVALPEEINDWLRRSPGTSEAPVKIPSPGFRHFEIVPGGGAQHAEVTVDDTLHVVSIYVYWS